MSHSLNITSLAVSWFGFLFVCLFCLSCVTFHFPFPVFVFSPRSCSVYTCVSLVKPVFLRHSLLVCLLSSCFHPVFLLLASPVPGPVLSSCLTCAAACAPRASLVWSLHLVVTVLLLEFLSTCLLLL